MTDALDRLREQIVAAATTDIPKSFLEDLSSRAKLAYSDTYQEVAQSRTVLREQRLAKIRQTRPFRMDWELAQAAQSAGLAYSAKELAENDWSYAYVVAGNFGFTQSYVPTLGALPQSAKFRDDLAAAARIPRLAIDAPEEVFQPRRFYGLFAHNPIGRTFTEDHQKLGSLQLCVPFENMSGWALEIGVLELIAGFPTATKDDVAGRGPNWKKDVAKKESDLS